MEHRGSVGVVPKLEMHRQSSCTQRTETCRLRHYAAADTQTTTNAPAALLAVFALAPDPAVGVHAFAAELAAEAPDAVMLGDAGAPAVLAGVPHAVMFADGSPCTSRGCARTRAVAACPCHACGSRARGASLSRQARDRETRTSNGLRPTWRTAHRALAALRAPRPARPCPGTGLGGAL